MVSKNVIVLAERLKNEFGLNVDVNGSYQIMIKAFPKSFDNGIEGVDLHPMILSIA